MKASTSIIEANEAFHSGARFWVVGEPAVSSWARTLDWYLNFQIFKTLKRPLLKSPEAIKNLVSELSIQDVDPEFLCVEEGSVIMVAAEPHLPTDVVLVIPWKKKLAPWVERACLVARKAKVEHLRLFLPEDAADELTDKQIEKTLKGLDTGIDLQVVKPKG